MPIQSCAIALHSCGMPGAPERCWCDMLGNTIPSSFGAPSSCSSPPATPMQINSSLVEWLR
eukprot:644625-Prorocentrum_lima.AAC.1